MITRIWTSFKRSASYAYATLIEPRSKSEDSRRREYILNVILTGSITILILLNSLVWYHVATMGLDYHGISPAAFTFITALFIFLLAFSRRGYFVAASYTLIALYFVSTSYAALRWGVNLPTVLLGYALVIVIAGILISTFFGFLVTVVTAVFILPVWYLEVHGTIPVQHQRFDGTDGIVFAVFYALIMIVTWLSNREIEKSLRRARKSEQQLTEQRDLLEVTVEERTQELRAAEFEKVRQIYQFAEFGQLATGLFHDLLNVLNAVGLRTESNREQQGADGNPQGSTDETSGATRQIESFIKAIRRQMNHRTSLEHFSLSAQMQQVIHLTSYKAIKEHVRVLFHDTIPGNVMYFGDPYKFQQIALNLILNGIDAYRDVSKNSDRMVVATLQHTHANVSLTVRDDGCGIPEKFLTKLFNPFFSTKNGAEGMGIGLASTKKIVEEDFHGAISVESKEGYGSTFTVTFPLTMAPDHHHEKFSSSDSNQSS